MPVQYVLFCFILFIEANTQILLKIRIILECQNRTISRGPNSIFSRLRKEGIDVSRISAHMTAAYKLPINFRLSPMSMSRCSLFAIGRRCVAMC